MLFNNKVNDWHFHYNFHSINIIHNTLFTSFKVNIIYTYLYRYIICSV